MRGLCAAAVLAAAAAGARAEANVVAVVSSESGPYAEALAGLREALETDQVQVVSLAGGAPRLPQGKVIVTFGSKAAELQAPGSAAVVHVMAPAHPRDGEDADVAMVPSPAALAAGLRRLQPGLARLGVVWGSDGFAAYVDALAEAGRALGVTVTPVRVAGGGDVPDALRTLHGFVDALWLPPDPQVINSGTFPLFADFARSARLPLFAPTSGVVGRGATASVAPSFREMGRSAGLAVRALLDGRRPARVVYPESIETVVGRAAAAQVGGRTSGLRLGEAGRVVP